MRPGADPLGVVDARRGCRPGSGVEQQHHVVDEHRRERLHALDRDALGELVEHLGQPGVRAGQLGGPLAHLVGEQQLAARRRPQAVLGDLEERWSATLNQRTSSTVSPQNSTRSGCSSVGGNTSRMPPRTANSPRRSTRSTRV